MEELRHNLLNVVVVVVLAIATANAAPVDAPLDPTDPSASAPQPALLVPVESLIEERDGKRTLHVPVGVQAVSTGVVAVSHIEISGTLVGRPATDVHLQAESISVAASGRIAAAGGESPTPTIGWVAQGENGTRGGSVIIESVTLHVAAGGVIAAGAGGSGGHTLGIQTAHGGSGGSGGSVILWTEHLEGEAFLQPGSGGSGGSAMVVLLHASSTPPNAAGGAGGHSGVALKGADLAHPSLVRNAAEPALAPRPVTLDDVCEALSQVGFGNACSSAEYLLMHDAVVNAMLDLCRSLTSCDLVPAEAPGDSPIRGGDASSSCGIHFAASATGMIDCDKLLEFVEQTSRETVSAVESILASCGLETAMSSSLASYECGAIVEAALGAVQECLDGTGMCGDAIFLVQALLEVAAAMVEETADESKALLQGLGGILDDAASLSFMPGLPGLPGTLSIGCAKPTGDAGQSSPSSGIDGGRGGDACVYVRGADGQAGGKGSDGWGNCGKGGEGGLGGNAKSAAATGGPGGNGYRHGGQGGHAHSEAQGGDGGDGGRGGMNHAGANCPGGIGGAGGNGVSGAATGGAGGNGLCGSGGAGGTATSAPYGGRGGQGGSGNPGGAGGPAGTAAAGTETAGKGGEGANLCPT